MDFNWNWETSDKLIMFNNWIYPPQILVNILAALNNISYYSDKGSDFMRLKLNVTETLVSALTIDDIQITGEVSKALLLSAMGV